MDRGVEKISEVIQILTVFMSISLQGYMCLHWQIHVKRGDHLKGARMLIRVANNISKFPSRKFILSSCCITALNFIVHSCVAQNYGIFLGLKCSHVVVILLSGW